MPDPDEDIAYCHACGKPMNVAPLAPFSNVGCPSCGQHTRVKREFGPYTLSRRHAIGGMSMVFVARDNTLDREVALKILSEEYSADERRITAFEEEARITASFSHPNVVRVLTTGKAFGRLYIAMELVPGGHFESRIRKLGKVPEAEMLPLAIEVAEGLKAAHAAGLIHRDMKPGNVLLDADGHAKIVDFGLALVTQGGTATAAEIWATPYYVPPETIEGAPEDFRADIYAFGSTLYHALAGKPPCDEETMSTDRLREAKQKVVPLGVAEPSLSVDTCRIVDRAMAYQPADRFSSYQEMIRQLESALKRLRSGGVQETSGNAARRRAERKRGEIVAFAMAALAVLGALGAGIFWVIRERPDAEIAVPPIVRKNPADAAPDGNTAAAGEIARAYRAARAAVEAGEFKTAAEDFAKLRENPAVQEPTRTWAAVEATAAAYLSGDATAGRGEAAAAARHLLTLPSKANPVGRVLMETVMDMKRIPPFPADSRNTSQADAPAVMAWLLAGLKDWEQGSLADAQGYFTAVAQAATPPDDEWLALYQEIARHYLADGKLLTASVFQDFPATAAACADAIRELEAFLPKLQTKGRAKFNIRAWQLDLLRHAKSLAETPPPPDPAATATDPAVVMEKLRALADSCQFREAGEYLATQPEEIGDATRASLLAVTAAAGKFLEDLEGDIAEDPAIVELPLKSGGTVTRLATDADGRLLATDAEGKTHIAEWSEFSADAMISLHQLVMKNPMTDAERVRRHESAISFDWLAGNRERALRAAAVLSEGSPAFKKRWDELASGLPK